MAQHTEELAILFADISGSTMLYETLGNTAARQMVVRCLTMMTDRLGAHGGTLIKTIGDEIMCTFPSAQAALQAACDMQDAVESGRPGGDTPMYVRIGFNYGEVLHEADDVHGDAVNVAARTTAVARARQILATHAAVNALPPELRGKVRHIQRAAIKGKQEQFDFFQVIWRSDDTAVGRVGTPAYRKPENLSARLVLRHRDQRFEVSERNTVAVLGRGPSCAIVVNDAAVSEQHAAVEYQLGKFFIVDRGGAATYVRLGSGDTAQLVGEDTVLHGSGEILLGRPCSDDDAERIEFVIRLAPDPS